MWLLDATKVFLKQIPDRDLDDQKGAVLPKFRYGILSHRWEDDGQEPTFEEYRVKRPSWIKKVTQKKIGVQKIEDCCRVARDHKLNLVWSDTCCIDKRSSAELQEAINSMYRFYERAEICFAYLRDVSLDTFDDRFIKSEWFTRGWTLQEL